MNILMSIRFISDFSSYSLDCSSLGSRKKANRKAIHSSIRIRRRWHSSFQFVCLPESFPQSPTNQFRFLRPWIRHCLLLRRLFSSELAIFSHLFVLVVQVVKKRKRLIINSDLSFFLFASDATFSINYKTPWFSIAAPIFRTSEADMCWCSEFARLLSTKKWKLLVTNGFGFPNLSS